MFYAGDILKCIDNSSLNDGTLTIDQLYKCLTDQLPGNNLTKIINDNDKVGFFAIDRFELVYSTNETSILEQFKNPKIDYSNITKETVAAV